MNKKKKILIYYHHFGGYGHGMRVYSICKALQLIETFDILVINSGVKQPELNIEQYAKILNLPALSAAESLFGGIKSDGDINSTMLQRQSILRKIADRFKPDLAVFEHFPFGRMSLEAEITGFIQILKSQNCKIYASVRDLILSKGESKYFILFSAILIHEDRNYNESADIPQNSLFTGRVHPYDNNAPMDKLGLKNELKIGHGKVIVASIGGGLDGFELLHKLIKIKPKIDEHCESIMFICTGGSIPESQWSLLNNNLPKGCILLRFSQDLMKYIQAADLFISMGGYNSINSHLMCDTPSMIFPRLTDAEQSSRAARFGFTCYNYKIISPEEFLSAVIDKLSKGSERKKIADLTGALSTARLISKALELKRAKIRVKTRCNLACSMCSWKDLEEQLETARILSIIDDLSILSVDVINFTGGEPTTYPGLQKVIEYAKEKGFKVSLSTNGYNLSPLQRLAKRLDYVDISIDSPKEQLNDQIRGREGSFKNAFESIKYLSEQGIKPHINVTIRPDNYSGIHELIALLHSFISSISFTLVDTTANGIIELKFGLEALHKYYFQEVADIFKSSIIHDIPVKITPFFEELKGLNSVQALSKFNQAKAEYKERFHEIFTLNGKNCQIAKDQIRINANGNIRPCCYLDDEHIHFGNINQSPLTKIAISDKYFNYVKLAKEGVGTCSVCQQGYTGYKELCLSKV